MQQSGASDFDARWNEMAAHMGFKPNSNALEYGGGGQSYNARA